MIICYQTLVFNAWGVEWTTQPWKCKKRRGLESFKYLITNKSKEGVFFYKIMLFFLQKKFWDFYSLLLLQSIITPKKMVSITRSNDIFLNHYSSYFLNG
jgi:hypothetical protein